MSSRNNEYPSDSELEIIANWNSENVRALFQYIRERWAYANAGYWREETISKDDFSGDEYIRPRYRYYLSTAGWSGNESILRALQRNETLWQTIWVQSRRGGHYIFELQDFTHVDV